MASLPGFALSVGLSMLWVLNYVLEWRILAYLAIIPGSLLFLMVFYLPETPFWLVEQNEIDQAWESLKFYRNSSADISGEMEEIKQRKAEKLAKSQNSFNFTIKRLFSKAFLKPYSCIGIIWSLKMLGGFPALTAYLISIMAESGSDLDPNLGSMIIGILAIIIAGILKFR